MIVLVEPAVGSFDLVEAADCTRFHLRAVGEPDPAALAGAIAEAGRLADDEHAWIRIDVIRRMARLCVDDGWDQQFDGMIEYATGKGWVDDEGEHLRAHIEWS